MAMDEKYIMAMDTDAEKQKLKDLLQDEGISSLDDLIKTVIEGEHDVSILRVGDVPKGRTIFTWRPPRP